VLGIEALLEILAGAGVRYIFGNPGSTESPLNDALVKVRAVTQRREQYAAWRTVGREMLLAEMSTQRAQRPMASLVLMGALSHVLPPNVAVVEEAVTTHQSVLDRLGVFEDPYGRFAHRGWALGWGSGCAIGVKLAWPDRPGCGSVGRRGSVV
jgi:thiamine pyrophosphate-dependent acetolactate synthase large subunit-like protein